MIEKEETRSTYKPHSVPRRVVIIYLGRRLLDASCSLPGAFCGTSRPNAPAWPCSRWGLPSRRHRCPRWWSLTPPFHPHA